MPKLKETCQNLGVHLGCDGTGDRLCPKLLAEAIFSADEMSSVPTSGAICGLTGLPLQAGVNFSKKRLRGPTKPAVRLLSWWRQ